VGKIRISRTLFAVVLATCIVLSFAVGLMVNDYLFPSVSNGGHQPQRVGANVYVTIETPMGMQAIPIENVITTIGLQQAATRFRTSGTYTACQYISIGNATASASLTKLTKNTRGLRELSAACGLTTAIQLSTLLKSSLSPGR
jgi:hypothetical protein